MRLARAGQVRLITLTNGSAATTSTLPSVPAWTAISSRWCRSMRAPMETCSGADLHAAAVCGVPSERMALVAAHGWTPTVPTRPDCSPGGSVAWKVTNELSTGPTSPVPTWSTSCEDSCAGRSGSVSSHAERGQNPGPRGQVEAARAATGHATSHHVDSVDQQRGGRESPTRSTTSARVPSLSRQRRSSHAVGRRFGQSGTDNSSIFRFLRNKECVAEKPVGHGCLAKRCSAAQRRRRPLAWASGRGSHAQRDPVWPRSGRSFADRRGLDTRDAAARRRPESRCTPERAGVAMQATHAASVGQLLPPPGAGHSDVGDANPAAGPQHPANSAAPVALSGNVQNAHSHTNASKVLSGKGSRSAFRGGMRTFPDSPALSAVARACSL